MPDPPEQEAGLYWQNSYSNGSSSNISAANEDGSARHAHSQANAEEDDALNTFLHDQPDEANAEEKDDALNNFLHNPREEQERYGSAEGLAPEWGSSEQAPEFEYFSRNKGPEDDEDEASEFDPVYFGDRNKGQEDDKSHTDDGREEDQQQREAAPEDVDNFMFEEDTRPKEHIQFFFEMGYADQDVDERLPPHIRQDRTARKQVRQLVKQHVQLELSSLDIEGRFFTRHSIPQYFEFEDHVYTFSYYLLPYELPVDPPPKTKSENFAANLEAEPQATQLAISNIILLLFGFALSLVVISCDTQKCARAGSIGQLLVGFAALLLACVEGYMTFLVASPPGS